MLDSPWTITYGDRSVGGSTGIAVNGPYSLDRSYDTIRVAFDVVVVAESFEELQTTCAALEADFTRRLVTDETFVIDIAGTAWTYTTGSTILAPVASIAKSAQPETDRGYARAYTVTIRGELPATADEGLREIGVHAALSAARQHTVTMRGIYTATADGTALANYRANFDAIADDYLATIKSTASWELVDETFTLDRMRDDAGLPDPNVCTFARSYTELLADQVQAALDDGDIRDHRISFTDWSQYPGDSIAETVRLHRVRAAYDCAVDIEETTDLQATVNDKIIPHVVALFRTTFLPDVWAVEDISKTYDETRKRVNVSATFVYRSGGGDNIVEVSQSVMIRETRNIDFTPLHNGGEFAVNLDPGWTVKERTWTSHAVILGDTGPTESLSRTGPLRNEGGAALQSIGGLSPPRAQSGAGGRGGGSGGGSAAGLSGWVTVSTSSQATPSYLGVPGFGQILITTVADTVTQRYVNASATSSIPIFDGA